MLLIITVITLAIACKLSLRKAKQPRLENGRYTKLDYKKKFDKVEATEYWPIINSLYSKCGK